MPEGAGPPPASTGTSATPTVRALLPRDFSVWAMFGSADIVVKFVILGLCFASVVTWSVFLAKGLELTVAVHRQRRALVAVNGLRSLDDAADKIDARSAAHPLILAARLELELSADALDDKEGLKERVGSHLERLEAALVRHINKGTGVLATIGATAPFVGLFGTVWGIMNSFIGISRAQSTNLAVVAPGIAEALLATAVGLLAAIPAVVIYNHFARQTAAYRALAADTAAAILRLVSRDLSRALVSGQGLTER